MAKEHGGRQQFRCMRCGVLIEGRADARGEVFAYDRAGWDGSPERPAICSSCNESPKTTLRPATEITVTAADRSRPIPNRTPKGTA